MRLTEQEFTTALTALERLYERDLAEECGGILDAGFIEKIINHYGNVTGALLRLLQELTGDSYPSKIEEYLFGGVKRGDRARAALWKELQQ